MDFSKRYQGLNEAQRQAVDTIDGPVMVIAGPGTGKTELLSMRAANILRQTDTLPENILCLTFTDSGANAMRSRLATIIGADAYKVAIHTFHSFGAEVINQNSQFFYQGAQFNPADDLDSYELMRTIFDGLHHKNPLAVQVNGEYTYLNDTQTVISELKRSGLTADELRMVLDANDTVINEIGPYLAQVFVSKPSIRTIDQLYPIVDRLRSLTPSKLPSPAITPLEIVLADSLQHAVNQASETSKTTAVTAWRNQWMKKNSQGEFTLKAYDRGIKLRAVADIYDKYLMAMHDAQLYDFDDMILRVVHAMQEFDELRFNLQERYQYIMVDEFQDTNMAQMRILYSLTDNPVVGGRPDIMAVGDDDQAIYSFQGADVGNIHAFRSTFADTRLIVLTDNYRSAPDILTHAQSVIRQGTDRLESTIHELDKTLAPHRPATTATVTLTELATRHDEQQWIVDQIEQQIATGQSPASIAVLARRHHELVALLSYFAQKNIAVNYERRNNVLDQPPIQAIELVADVVIALAEQRHDDASALIPQLLAHPAFAIDPTVLWRLSLTAYQNHQTWMEVMATTPDLAPIHQWIVSLAAAQTPLEYTIDELLGVPDRHTVITSSFTSPLYEYYFSPTMLAVQPDSYLQYLDGLRTIRDRLRHYASEETPSLQTFIEFIRLHRQLGRAITSVQARGEHLDSAVTLMTAHKSKGMEFDTVYIVGAVDSSWGERVRSRSRLVGYPENLPLAPAGDTPSERLRLFFVAMTRAKQRLRITYSNNDLKGKATSIAGFLLSDNWNADTVSSAATLDHLTQAAALQWYHPVIQPITRTMRDLLTPKLDSYKLSHTHLTHFLDITRGGPQRFLAYDLLRFPQAKAPNAAYGTAVHLTLQRTHAHITASGEHRPIEDILHDYETNLRAQHLPTSEFDTYLQKGIDALTTFLDQKYTTFRPGQKTELNFAGQSVRLGDARLTGSLDLVDIADKSIVVTDYKTGKPVHSWSGSTDYEKIKLHHYRQQLMFYHLLIAHSRDWHSYTVDRSVLQFVEPTQAGDIIHLDASFTPDQLEQFARLVQSVWRRIITLDMPNVSEFDTSYKGILAFEQSLLDD